MIIKRMRLYSDLEQREFNSKSMKALRKVWDLKNGMMAKESLIHTGRSGSKTVGEVMNEIRGIGRRANRGLSRKGIHGSINAKVDPLDIHSIGNNANELRHPNSAELINNKMLQDFKLTRHRKVDGWRAQNEYDHSITPISTRQRYAKMIMKGSKM